MFEIIIFFFSERKNYPYECLKTVCLYCFKFLYSRVFANSSISFYEVAVEEIVMELKTTIVCCAMHRGIPGKKARHDRHRAMITIESVGVHISWGPRYNRKNRFVGVLQELPAWRSSRQVRFHRGSGLLLFSSLRDYGFLPPLPWRPPTTWSSIPAEGIDEIATPKAKRRTEEWRKTCTNICACTHAEHVSFADLFTRPQRDFLKEYATSFCSSFDMFVETMKVKSVEDLPNCLYSIEVLKNAH